MLWLVHYIKKYSTVRNCFIIYRNHFILFKLYYNLLYIVFIMTSYEIYSHDFLSCPYCGKITNLYYAMVHINGKKCKRLQDLVTKDVHIDLYLKFIREINKLKSSIKFDDENL